MNNLGYFTWENSAFCFLCVNIWIWIWWQLSGYLVTFSQIWSKVHPRSPDEAGQLCLWIFKSNLTSCFSLNKSSSLIMNRCLHHPVLFASTATHHSWHSHPPHSVGAFLQCYSSASPAMCFSHILMFLCLDSVFYTGQKWKHDSGTSRKLSVSSIRKTFFMLLIINYATMFSHRQRQDVESKTWHSRIPSTKKRKRKRGMFLCHGTQRHLTFNTA